jgi:hypothetical protein
VDRGTRRNPGLAELEARAAELERRLAGVTAPLRQYAGSGGDDDPALAVPRSHRPAAVEVRLIGPAEVLDAAAAHLAALHGDAWQQPGARMPSRYDGGGELLRGTLIIPVPR